MVLPKISMQSIEGPHKSVVISISKQASVPKQTHPPEPQAKPPNPPLPKLRVPTDLCINAELPKVWTVIVEHPRTDPDLQKTVLLLYRTAVGPNDASPVNPGIVILFIYSSFSTSPYAQIIAEP